MILHVKISIHYYTQFIAQQIGATLPRAHCHLYTTKLY